MRASACSMIAAPAIPSTRAGGPPSGPICMALSGARPDTFPGFRYSASMREKAEAGLTWTEENLRALYPQPEGGRASGFHVLPGTTE